MKNIKSNYRSIFKNKLVDREVVYGAWTSIGHPQITEIMIKSGVDFLGIDIEHSTISQEQVLEIVTVCQLNDIVCLPRVVSHNSENIKRILDSGADGIIIPNIENTEQVQNIIDCVKYPPIGKRGYGIAKAQGYGYEFEEYFSTWNNDSIIIIQIESIQAVNNIESLLKFDQIDGVMVGPYDISGSMDIPGQISHPKVISAGQNVVDASKTYAKSCGTQDIEPTNKSIKSSIEAGYNFIVLASDVFILWKWGEKIKKIISSEI